MASARRTGGGGRAAKDDGPTWETVHLAPIVLVRGSEGLLADRAIDNLLAQARAARPETEVTRVAAAAYERGQLATYTSPSLFDDHRLVLVEGVEQMSDAFLEDALAYVAAPAPDAIVLLRHDGGQRGKKLLDTLARSSYPVVRCEPISRDADKADLVQADVRRAGRRIDPEAVRALVEALGSDVRELAAATAQLLADTQGTLTEDLVDRYHGGRVEATGFKVADAAVAGRAGQAVALLRHAAATGTGPVPIVAALAAKVRLLAKVSTGRTAGELGIAPWQERNARRDLSGWSPEGLAAAILAVAQADEEVKGASRDPLFAAERAVLRVAGARRH